MPASTQIDALFNKAVTHHQKGELDRASALYRQVIDASPEDMNALQNLGLIEKQHGNFAAAIDLLEQVHAKHPGDPALLNNLGSTWRDAGDNQKAIALFEKGLALNPDIPALHNNLGVSLQALNRHDEAVTAFEAALQRQPGFAEAHNNLAISLQTLGRLSEAISHFRLAVNLRPGYAIAQAGLGKALLANHDSGGALAALQRALKTIETAELHQLRANALSRLGQQHDALQAAERALELDPDHVRALSQKAECFAVLGRGEEALALSAEAIRRQPNDPELFVTRALICDQIGDAPGAFAAYQDAIAVDPDHAESHYLAARALKIKEETDFVRATRQAYERATPGSTDRQNFAFALGKIEEDLGNYTKAFTYLEEANRIYRSAIDYDAPAMQRQMDDLRKTFTQDWFKARENDGDPDPAPIFILGMPRSGTTLVEQILASHPKVFGAGELAYMDAITSNARITDPQTGAEIPVAAAKGAQLRSLADYYLKSIRLLSDAPHVTDKLPGNFWRVGLIKAILPNAKIIHCKRNPLDNCFAIYKVRFGSAGHLYAYDPADLGHYYGLYTDLMAHWHDVLPGQILDVNYEDVVADQETQSRRLLDFCGLDWDPAVLDFHKTDRAVRTASSQQVRQPIYKSSVKLSERYGDLLDPLKKALAANV